MTAMKTPLDKDKPKWPPKPPLKLDRFAEEELEGLQEKYDELRPAHIVAFAQNPSTALHKHFEWDDSQAAIKYRLQQAQKVLTVFLQITPYNPPATTASVKIVKAPAAAGTTFELPARTYGKNEQLAHAIEEFREWKTRHQRMKQLEGILSAIEEAERQCQSVDSEQLDNALNELRSLKLKYLRFNQLEPIFDAIELVEEKLLNTSLEE